MLGGGCGRVLAQLAQFDPRVVGAAMRLGRDLDLGLQKLAADMARARRNRRPGTARPAFPPEPRRFRASDKKIFFLDAELKIDRRAQKRALRSPGGTSVRM